MTFLDEKTMCQVCGHDGEIGKCDQAQDNGHVEYCDEEYVCYYVYESTAFLKILMSNMLIDKSNVSELDGYDNAAKYFRFCGIDLDIGTDNCYSQNTEEGHIFVCTCKDSERPCNRDADCLFTCN